MNKAFASASELISSEKSIFFIIILKLHDMNQNQLNGLNITLPKDHTIVALEDYHLLHSLNYSILSSY